MIHYNPKLKKKSRELLKENNSPLEKGVRGLLDDTL
jgi:hypothetical protein